LADETEMIKVVKLNWERPWVHAAIVFWSFLCLYILFFAPILLTDRLLAPGDGIAYFLPAFYRPKTLWTNLVFGGYPIAADAQNMTWYPLAWLLSGIPHAWNAFILLAYALAGSFAYAYTYTVTRSRLAGAVAGIVYSMSGFMMTHLGHAGMIHAAAWIPLLVCALERLRHRIEAWWAAIGIVSVVCCFLGGHPQISVYGLGIGLFYAVFLGWSAPIGRGKFYRVAAGMMLVGVGLCAIQILPTLELSRLSLRREMTFEVFLQLSLPRWQTLQLIFPYLFGAGFAPPTRVYRDAGTLWGKWMFGEISGYMGLLPMMLAGIGTMRHPDRPIARFWFWFGLITLMLAFGGDLGLGQLLYHVPVYNQFRAQGRHFIEVAMAVSVLAGLGVAAIAQRLASQRLIFKTIGVGSLVMLASVVSIGILANAFQMEASKVGIAQLDLGPWSNPAIGIPIGIFLASIIVLLIWRRRLTARWSGLLLLTVITIDLSSFGWFIPEIGAPATARLSPSAIAQRYQVLLQTHQQRWMTAVGVGAIGESHGLFPNLTRLWDLPNAGGYSPLTLTRVSQMMQMTASGALSHLPLPLERGLDLMAVRYLLIPNPVVNPAFAIAPMPPMLAPSMLAQSVLAPSVRWQPIETLADGGIIYENQQAMPRTWLVRETVKLPPEAVLAAINTSRLPDGRIYQPETMALVEAGGASFQSAALQPSDRAMIVTAEETRVEVQTTTANPAFLVLSDVNYPGWQAWIDGQSAPIVQTNYVQRGVQVPAGEHTVRFEFHPWSFQLGTGIAVAALLWGLDWLWRLPPSA
jgi:Bacterial membrane protein YfhO